MQKMKMGQAGIFEILEELGGSATTAEIKKAAIRNYGATDTIVDSCKSLLIRLALNGYIDYEKSIDTWTIPPGTKMMQTVTSLESTVEIIVSNDNQNVK